LQKILKKAASNVKHIVLPEGDDPRMITAAKIATEMKIAKITMLGNADKIKTNLKSAGANLDEIKVIDPVKSEKLPAYAEQFFNLRKSKGITEDQALETVKDVMYFANMMLKGGDCDGIVAGAAHSTPDTVRPALQIVKPAPGFKTVSSMFFMCKGEQVLIFSDCGLNEFPTTEQLVDIVVSTVKTTIQFDFEPRVAVLSYSTKGSAKSEKPKMMADVAKLAKEKLDQIYGAGKIAIDGELQFDAAYVPAIAAKKAPGSPVEGKANVFIFPDLGAGNLAYKITERLGGYDAYGPILQGLGKPVNDLSRGCSVDDIVATIAITSIQAM
jgi:phosphate acetyltransferase